ncbi:hypothetical protein [Janthinobacterium sp. MDT1-19]|uniref:hypothetical protein n=1 Tax=Janthinobacterium sp. MDT1-19 TaxID=1259339 RepID=UPI003F202511
MRLSFPIAVIALFFSPLSNAYDQNYAVTPVYNGSCANDNPLLDKHFTYWNSGNHGSDPTECKYAVDQLIMHQEMAYYISRPQRCQHDGMTYMPTTGTGYTGMLYEIDSDGKLKQRMNDAVGMLRKISYTPSEQQKKELDRQSNRVG